MPKNSKAKKNSSISWKYSSALESVEHISISPVYNLFIGGKFVKPISKKYFYSTNPANEEKLAKIALAGKSDVNKAVLAARSAYNNVWEKMDPKERGKYIYRIARLIQEKSRELAIIESLDGGKPIRESRDIDIPLAAAHFFYYAGWADKLDYAFPGRGTSSIGVAGQIIPWNFPLLMAAWTLTAATPTRGNWSDRVPPRAELRWKERKDEGPLDLQLLRSGNSV